LMMALAHSDLETHTGRRLRKAFPECFSARDFRGPVPLSVLQEKAVKINNTENFDFEIPEEMLESTGVLRKFNIPHKRFSVTYENRKRFGYPLLPQEMANKCNFGALVSLRDRPYFIAESVEEEVCLVPAQYIDMAR
ncbi:MAG: hypothetical protein Q7S86_05555, partial [bacterium]|nr:hypothetical protein [bacterium]